MKNPEEIDIGIGAGATVTALAYEAGHQPPNASLILAHGAGAGQRSPFMTAFARGLSTRGIDITTFDFPYIQARRRLPDRRPVLEACYAAVIEATRNRSGHPLFIGGKSMGGRIATQVAAANAHLSLAGLVLLGYPLHPPGRPAERRDGHLKDVQRPMLIVQGSRDGFGTPAEFEPLLGTLTPAPTLRVVQGGDHSFKVAGAGSQGLADVYNDVQQAIAEWIVTVSADRPASGPR